MLLPGSSDGFQRSGARAWIAAGHRRFTDLSQGLWPLFRLFIPYTVTSCTSSYASGLIQSSSSVQEDYDRILEAVSGRALDCSASKLTGSCYLDILMWLKLGCFDHFVFCMFSFPQSNHGKNRKNAQWCVICFGPAGPRWKQLRHAQVICFANTKAFAISMQSVACDMWFVSGFEPSHLPEPGDVRTSQAVCADKTCSDLQWLAVALNPCGPQVESMSPWLTGALPQVQLPLAGGDGPCHVVSGPANAKP